MDNVAKHFIETVVDMSKRIGKLFKTNISMIKTPEEDDQHKSIEICNLCKSRFTEKNHKVVDHNHLSGRFRQSLCKSCNFKL